VQWYASRTISKESTMTVQAAPARTASAARTALLLTAAFAVAGVVNATIAFTALAVGASSAYPPLMPPAFLAFTAIGVGVGYLGWRIVRRVFARPARVLRVLVPVVLVLSWVPDVVLAITGFIPGTTVTGALALALMHAVVVAVAVPVYLRVAPVA
jgi:hypothetical protein